MSRTLTLPGVRRLGTLCLAAWLLSPLPLPALETAPLAATEGAAKTSAANEFRAFVEAFLDAGTDREAPSVPTLSASEFEAALARTRAQQAALDDIDSAALGPDDRIDWQFARSILAGREIQQAEFQAWRMDPRRYMDFGAVSRQIGRPGPLPERIDAIAEALRQMPVQLANGEAQLRWHVPRFRELALFMADNGQALFDRELPAFIEEAGAGADGLKVLARQAEAALAGYRQFLREELPERPERDFALGEAGYERILAEQYLLDHDAESLWEYGWAHFEATVAELEALAADIAPDLDWQQLALQIKNDYPEPSKMIEAHQLWVDRAADHIRERDLIPLPWPERVEVVPRAEYLRKTSYYGNFEIVSEPDADGVFTSQWHINPFESQWDEKTRQEYLTEHDWGVIIVTAPHEAYGGHHVQGLYQLHNPRPLRRTHGVPLFTEGWGLYNEQLMQETGFFPDERIHLRQLQLKLWRNARVIYEVGIHTGRMSYDEAVALMTERVGFLPWAAQLEVDSAAASPGYFIGYYVGMQEILKLREEYRERAGDEFSLREFHRELLSIGNMPPALMREALLGAGD